MDALRTKRNTIAVIALLVLRKIYLSAILQLNLDEAYYGLCQGTLTSVILITRLLSPISENSLTIYHQVVKSRILFPPVDTLIKPFFIFFLRLMR